MTARPPFPGILLTTVDGYYGEPLIVFGGLAGAFGNAQQP